MNEEHSFLGNTQNVIIGTLLSITRYEITDRNMRGGSIWLAIPNSGENPNNLGVELIKIAMPYAMFDQQQAKQDAGDFTLPAEFEVLTEMRMGGANKPALFVKSMRPVKANSVTADDLAAKPNASGATGSASSSTAAGASGATAQQPNK